MTLTTSLLVDHYHAANSQALEGGIMEFRLLYNGPLPSNGDARDKLKIRRQIHPQLQALWREDVHLASWISASHTESRADELARNFSIGDFNFVPLINQDFGLMCSLDILFLRRGEVGSVIKTGGDLDNRLKTLLDALRTPRDRNECGGELPTDDEKPFYTLMTEDSLVGELRVEADRLLKPTDQSGRAARENVELVIKVKTRIVDYCKGHPYPHFA